MSDTITSNILKSGMAITFVYELLLHALHKLFHNYFPIVVILSNDTDVCAHTLIHTCKHANIYMH